MTSDRPTDHETNKNDLTVMQRSTGSHGREEDDALRQQILAEIETAKHLIQSQIEALSLQQFADEHEESIEQLQSALKSYDALATTVKFSEARQLPALSKSVQRQVGQTHMTVTNIATNASVHSAHALLEMTSEQIHHLQVSHNEQAQAFHRYERESFNRIQQLATQNGIDISAIQTNRDTLLKQRHQAQTNGDRVGTFKADALLAINNYHGLGKVGGTKQEIEEARKQAQEAINRAIKEAQIEAMREGRKQGLSGDDLKQHVTTKTREFIEEELRPKQEKLRKSNQPPTELEQLQIDERNADRVEGNKYSQNRMNIDISKAMQVDLNGNAIMKRKLTSSLHQDTDQTDIGELKLQQNLPNGKVKTAQDKTVKTSGTMNF